MRASNRPYACANNPCVLSRALVYWHVPYQHWQRRCARRRRRDDQVASRDDGVLAAARVVLELLVAPARATDVVSPLGRVDRRAVGPVELVRPRERPARERGVGARVGACARPRLRIGRRVPERAVPPSRTGVGEGPGARRGPGGCAPRARARRSAGARSRTRSRPRRRPVRRRSDARVRSGAGASARWRRAAERCATPVALAAAGRAGRRSGAGSHRAEGHQGRRHDVRQAGDRGSHERAAIRPGPVAAAQRRVGESSRLEGPACHGHDP